MIMQEKNVLIVGTGTIGLPLIGLFARHRERLGIDNIFFNKNTPLKHDSAQIKQMTALGAKLVTDIDKFEGFSALGLSPACTKEEAMERATVVIDCTPSGVGLTNKLKYYDKYKHNTKGFIAQGSEFGFGKMYAKNITSLGPDDQFVHVVSCNTHNIAALIKSFDLDSSVAGVNSGDFVCLRRANDISQDDGFIPSLELGKHKDPVFGTHHARDAFYLLKDQFPNIQLYSSAVKSNTQYMHSIRFSLTLSYHNSKNFNNLEDLVDAFRENPMVALTDKMSTNKVFSFGRDYGLYGRILSQTVVCTPTLSLRRQNDRTIVTGLCMTPQDGNSLLSSIAATLHFINPDKAEDLISIYNPYVFQEI